ncbi:MAG TPA: mycofactocin-coupled SDR family oxidoreductase [Amycolatopsis sp.]|nr:mycofactocin-coupled SDR family oxidoreductase [Amycolatopsis sp.]
MGEFDGRVVFITGGARGQGRSHALAFAEAGADVALCDSLQDVASVPYPLAVEADLKETVSGVEAFGRRCIALNADVRDTKRLGDAVETAVRELGKIDILIANAGILSFGAVEEITDAQWDDMIATNLTGVFKAMRAVVPHMKRQGYGRIIATSSMGGRFGNPHLGHYVASKFGVVGLVKTLALELAGDNITVNAVCPSNVNSPMVNNRATYRLFRPDLEEPTAADIREPLIATNKIPVPWVDPSDVSHAMLTLASERSWYMTGSTVDVGCGTTATMP